MNQIKDEELPGYLQKWLRITRGNESHFGLLIGRSEAIMATGPSSTTRPWVLRTQAGDIHFAPEDRWHIEISPENGA